MRNNSAKKIYQYDNNYTLIKEWSSMNDIIVANKMYKKRNISDNIRQINKSAYSFIWSYNNNLAETATKITCVIDKSYFIEKDIFTYQTDKEYWKDITNYETRYKISNYGKIYNKQLNIIMKNHQRDYMCIKLVSVDGIAKTCFIHVLVANHFILNQNNNKVINHIDHNKYNNHYKNLEWLTHSGNSQAYHDQKVKHEIVQYDLENKLIKEWNSIDEILEHNKTYKRDSILRCLAGSAISRYGYIWKYKDINANQKKIINIAIHKDEIFKNIGVMNNIDFCLYDISNYGKVRNTKTRQILRPGLSTTGYYIVSLVYGNNQKISRKIHQLVAFKFCEKSTELKDCVNHIDENKLNNYYKNLEWMTSRENTIHSNGRKVQQIDIQTDQIINTYNSVTDAANAFNKNSLTCIVRVCQGTRKTSCGYKWKYAE